LTVLLFTRNEIILNTSGQGFRDANVYRNSLLFVKVYVSIRIVQ
jgi:hypothetical protein